MSSFISSPSVATATPAPDNSSRMAASAKRVAATNKIRRQSRRPASWASSDSSASSSLVFMLASVAIVAIVASLFIGEAMAGGGNKGKGGEDIILYNGNIIMRGKKKEGNIVLANSHGHEEVEMLPSPFFGFRRR